MGLFDKFKSKASEHSDKVNEGLDKAGDAASNATGGKFDDQIDSGKDAAGDLLGTGGSDEAAAEDGGESSEGNGGGHRRD